MHPFFTINTIVQFNVNLPVMKLNASIHQNGCVYTHGSDSTVLFSELIYGSNRTLWWIDPKHRYACIAHENGQCSNVRNLIVFHIWSWSQFFSLVPIHWPRACTHILRANFRFWITFNHSLNALSCSIWNGKMAQ